MTRAKAEVETITIPKTTYQIVIWVVTGFFGLVSSMVIFFAVGIYNKQKEADEDRQFIISALVMIGHKVGVSVEYKRSIGTVTDFAPDSSGTRQDSEKVFGILPQTEKKEEEILLLIP